MTIVTRLSKAKISISKYAECEYEKRHREILTKIDEMQNRSTDEMLTNRMRIRRFEPRVALTHLLKTLLPRSEILKTYQLVDICKHCCLVGILHGCHRRHPPYQQRRKNPTHCEIRLENDRSATGVANSDSWRTVSTSVSTRSSSESGTWGIGATGTSTAGSEWRVS